MHREVMEDELVEWGLAPWTTKGRGSLRELREQLEDLAPGEPVGAVAEPAADGHAVAASGSAPRRA
jgi:hypothetical protein